MKLTKILALLLCVALCISCFAGCNQPDTNPSTNATDPSQNTPSDPSTPSTPAPSTDPLTMIYEGYYSYTYPIEGMDDMCAFFHFYPEAPVIGSVFYASYAWNQIVFAGTYTVEKVDHEYTVWESREASLAEGAEKITGTAPYTITFYDFDGNLLDSCGYDGEKLYNDMTVITGTGGADSIYSHDIQGEASPYVGTYNGELGMTYLSFVNPEDPTCTVALEHNGSYTDLVSVMVQGKWVMAEGAEGTYEFTLTPNESYDVGAKLVVAADKMSATYTSDDGETVMELVNASTTGPKLKYQLKGQFDVGAGMADVVLDLYDDGNCEIYMSAFGSRLDLDKGTYTLGADGYTITCNFETAGELSTYLSEAGVSMDFVQAGSMFGDLNIKLDFVPVESEEPTVAYTLAGIHSLGDPGNADLTLSLMSDGTCSLVASAFGQSMDIDAGTYSIGADGYTITCVFTGAGELVTYLNGATVSLHYIYAASPLGPIDSVLEIVAA